MAACAIVVLTGAATASASRSHATRLSPPTIHETFTVLPCRGTPNQRTTLELEGCAEHQILKSDKQIDTLDKTIFTKLAANAAKMRFIAAHNAWLGYRHAYCLSQSDAAQGGTDAALIDATCTAALNVQHITSLHGFLSDLGPK
jgi:uncharacterized protein YecT (DUF1311 family)